MPLALAERHRSDIADLVVLAQRDLALILAGVDDSQAIRALLAASLPDLVSTYGAAAATLAADHYELLRETERITGRHMATPATLPGRGRTDSLAGWAVRGLADPVTSPLKLAAGGLHRIIANASRETLMDSTLADPQALGWQRVGAGECSFCSMLIARGAVYTRRSVNFGAHDNCNCSAVPAWGGRPRPVEPYTPSTRNITDADRARVRRWIAEPA